MGGDPRFAGTNHNDIELFVVTDSQNFVTHVAKDYAGMDPRHGDGVLLVGLLRELRRFQRPEIVNES